MQLRQPQSWKVETMTSFTALVAAVAIAAVGGAAAAEPKSYTDLKKDEMGSHQHMMGDGKGGGHEMMNHHSMRHHMMRHHMMRHHHMKH